MDAEIAIFRPEIKQYFIDFSLILFNFMGAWILKNIELLCLLNFCLLIIFVLVSKRNLVFKTLKIFLKIIRRMFLFAYDLYQKCNLNYYLLIFAFTHLIMYYLLYFFEIFYDFVLSFIYFFKKKEFKNFPKEEKILREKFNRKSSQQILILNKFFSNNNYPSASEKKQISEETGLSLKEIQDWLCNLRRKLKIKKL